MAKLKKSELKGMNVIQLKEKLDDIKKELMKINAQVAIGTNLKNPGHAKILKKTVARIYTFIGQKKQEGGQKRKAESNE